MANWIVTTYATVAALETAVELLANTVTIQVIPYQESGMTKYVLIQSV